MNTPVSVCTAMPRIADIKQAVAREFGIDVARLSEPSQPERYLNSWDIAHPRQVAMVLAMLLTEHSESRIGHFFGERDHSTVYAARKAVEKRRARSVALHNAMRRITLSLVRR